MHMGFKPCNDTPLQDTVLDLAKHSMQAQLHIMNLAVDH